MGSGQGGDGRPRNELVAYVRRAAIVIVALAVFFAILVSPIGQGLIGLFVDFAFPAFRGKG